MPTHTPISAAQYLAECGYTVKDIYGQRNAPKADTVRRWCLGRKIAARQVGRTWLIEQEALDRLLSQ